MQELSWKMLVIFSCPIHCISNHRAAKMGHMHSNLMRPPGLNNKFYQTESVVKFLHNLPIGDGMSSA